MFSKILYRSVRFFLISAIIAWPCLAAGQTITVSPTSVSFWGSAKSTTMIGAEYKGVEAIYLHAWRTYWDREDGVYRGGFAGVMINQGIEAGRVELSGGAGLFHRRFPTEHGQRLNFRVRATYRIGRFQVGYSHISNGFGLRNPLNPGVDHLLVSYRF
jgi:hypothetical protein